MLGMGVNSSGVDEEEGGGTSVVAQDQLALDVPKLYKVILLNDDYTPMEFVVEVLKSHFRKNEAEATKIMLTVHKEGRGLCGVYPLEIAETKVSNVTEEARRNGYPLQCIAERE